MQRLVMKIWHGDGCTYSCIDVVPIMGKDPETVMIEFMLLKDKHVNKNKHGYEFYFYGERFNEYCDDPIILTVDEWYKDCKTEK